ncbi:uncharacterized protein [Branchiostoma lanceolatum]|uniref:uncharacterized protein n=1 Tax=Branchiostoma lanceolatum TaxID=7740 RepID=UPI0034549EF3
MSEEEEDYAFHVGTINGMAGKAKLPNTKITIHQRKVSFLIDTGASVNILGEVSYRENLKGQSLQESSTVIRPYGGRGPLVVLGKFQTVVEANNRTSQTDIFVVRGTSGNLLSYETAKKLGLVEVHIDVNATVTDNGNTQGILQEYKDVFRGIGKLKDFQVKLHVDPSVVPVKQPYRRIPFHVRKQVEKELQELERQDIIERVDGPTPWVSPIVEAPKLKIMIGYSGWKTIDG